MRKKLLDKTRESYLIFSVVVVLMAAPLFYVLTTRLFKHEADEVLRLRKAEFVTNNLPTLTAADIDTWNRISRDTKILPRTRKIKKDRLFDEQVLNTLDQELVPYRVLISPITVGQERKVFMTRVSLIEADALIKNIGIAFFSILVLLLAGLFVITRIQSKSLWSSFYATLATLEKFDLERNKVPEFQETSIAEFERLNSALRRLLEKNILVFESQKEFIENAAHELQTPIALFLARLDVLVQQMPIDKNFADSLSTLQQSASRIIRLNKNLLLLSKIENDQYAANEQVQVEKLLERQAAFLGEQLEEKRVTLELNLASSLTIAANITLLESAIGNLLLNALRHNVPDGRIVVSLHENVLEIANTGTEPLRHAEKLFQRFATPGTNGGSGLGLAIVRKICEQHGWQLSYGFENNLHQFTIVF